MRFNSYDPLIYEFQLENTRCRMQRQTPSSIYLHEFLFWTTNLNTIFEMNAIRHGFSFYYSYRRLLTLIQLYCLHSMNPELLSCGDIAFSRPVKQQKIVMVRIMKIQAYFQIFVFTLNIGCSVICFSLVSSMVCSFSQP